MVNKDRSRWLKQLSRRDNCELCQEKIGNIQKACSFCEKVIFSDFKLQNRCSCCDLPIVDESFSFTSDRQASTPDLQLYCADCLNKTFLFSTNSSVTSYNPNSKRLIERFKEQQHLHLAPIISSWMITTLNERFNRQHNDIDYQNLCGFDIVVPVPSNKSSLKKRGFSPALELSRPIAKYFNRPLLTQLLVQRDDSIEQKTLSKKQRLSASNKLFEINPELKRRRHKKQLNDLTKGKRALLVDDVMTTGSTANQNAKLLLQLGVTKVDVITFARTAKKER